MTQSFDLASRAMLVSLTLHAWGGQKLDRNETARVSRDNRAQMDAVRVTKDLVGKHLDPVRQSERNIRALHNRYTLPWSDGSRLLPTSAFEKYRPEMQDLIDRHENEVIPAFVEDYNAVVVPNARVRLGDLFSAEDFPRDIGRRFGVKLRFLPVPNTDDIRVKLSADDVAALRQEVEEATREAYEAANSDLLDRALKPLERLVEALGEFGPGKRLSKALVNNVAEVAAIIPMLDLSGRPEVTVLARELERIGRHSTDDLALPFAKRARKSVADEAAKAISKAKELFA